MAGSRSRFGRGADERARTRLDLGKPRWLLRTLGHDGWEETWIWCDRCLARKAPLASGNLVPGWRGGFLHTFRDLPSADGKGYRRRCDLVACDCALGDRIREAWSKHLRRELPEACRFRPEQLLGPPLAQAARDPKNTSTEIVGPFGEPDRPLPEDLAAADGQEQEELVF